MAEADWKTLVANLRARTCVPFLGAGACLPTLPTGAELAAEVLKRAALDLPYPFDERTNLAKVTQYIASVWNDVPRTKHLVAEVLQERVERAQPKREQGLPAIHRCLAQLRLPIYITTNYDDLLEQALAEIPGVRPCSEVCRWSNELLLEISRFDDGHYEPSSTEPVVFHLHGRWQEKRDGGAKAVLRAYDSFVLTEDDYLDFLINVSREIVVSPTGRDDKTALPLTLRRAIKKQALLFVGYSLTDVNFLFILRALVETMQRHSRVQRVAAQLSPAVLPQGYNQEDYQEQVEQYFDWTHDVRVVWKNADDLAAELTRDLELPPWPKPLP